MRCLRVILGVRLMDKVGNEDIRRRLNITNTICEDITKRRLKWFGHVARMRPDFLPFQAYKNDFKNGDHQAALQHDGGTKWKKT